MKNTLKEIKWKYLMWLLGAILSDRYGIVDSIMSEWIRRQAI